MPELAEVETVARQLAAKIIGRRLVKLEINDQKLAFENRTLVLGRTVQKVFRSGKEIVLDFSSTRKSPHNLWLAVHLRMTGRLVWHPKNKSAKEKHMRAVLYFIGGQVRFCDSRRFGLMRVATTAEAVAPSGLDPTSAQFTVAALGDLLRRSNQEIKPWLLRQDRLVGLGNIYAAEILFAAGIDPRRAGRSLTPLEIKRLHAAARKILQNAIRHGGTTISDFADCEGEAGGYMPFLAVYGRDGERCRRCKETVERIVQQQRSTFYCPACQV